jgi:PQQ-like domain
MMDGRHHRKAGIAAVAALVVALGAGSASAAPGDSWLTARGSDLRNGQARNETVITKSSINRLAPVWSAAGQSVEGTEAIVNGSAVYTVTGDAKLRRLRINNGSTVWTTALAGPGETPTLDGNTVYALGGGRVKAVMAADGGVRFNVAVPRSCGDGFVCDGGLGVDSGRVVVGNGMLLSILNGSSGAVLSSTDVSAGDLDSNGGGTPGIDGNGAAWYSFKFTATAPVPPSTANPVPTPKVTGNGHSTALITGGRVFVTGTNQGIHAFNVNTGAKVDFAPGAVGQHQNMATDGTRLFDVTFEDGVRTLTAHNLSNGSVAWRKTGAFTSPLAVNGMVIVGENRDGLAVYDAASGALLKRVAGTARGADPVVVGGRLFAGFSASPVPTGSMPPLTMLGV